MSKEELSPVQLEIVEEMIIESLEKAGKSMEKMLRIRISPKISGFGIGSVRRFDEFDQLGRFKVNLMKVAFEGEINGALYFIINTFEMDMINQVCLPDQVNATRNSEAKMIKHDFMSEIENMIANQSIAALSEFLGVEAIPRVPEIQIIRGDEVNDYLESENANIGAQFYVKSLLHGVVVDISPHFIWLIDENFIRISKLNIVS